MSTTKTTRKLSPMAQEAERLAAQADAPAAADAPETPDGGQDIPAPADLGEPAETPATPATIAQGAEPEAKPSETAPAAADAPEVIQPVWDATADVPVGKILEAKINEMAESIGIPAAMLQENPGAEEPPADTRPTREDKKRLVHELNDQIIADKAALREYIKAETIRISRLERDLRRLVETSCQGE